MLNQLPLHYIQPLFRPPSEAHSLILQVTNGCSWNQCTFCDMYKAPQKKFSTKSQDEVLEEIKRCGAKPKQPGTAHKILLPITAVLIFTASLSFFYAMVSHQRLPNWLATTGMTIRAYGLGHIYHIFPTMQVERHELIVEGSYDRINWKAYTFRYKPQNLAEKPKFIVPHQPRLDWMIWFVPPKFDSQIYWFKLFLRRLSQGSPQVLALLRDDPFAGAPPPYLRVLVYRYHFTNWEERKKTGHWWKREFLGEFPYVAPRRP